MESFLGLIIIILIFALISSVNSKFKELVQKIDILSDRINRLKTELDKKSVDNFVKDVQDKKDIISKVEDEVVLKEIKPVEIVNEKPKELTLEDIKIEIPQPVLEPEKDNNVAIGKETERSYNLVEGEKSWFENFMEKNPDLEKFIGENLINKIGILILVLGISFFVKYAIDKNWINEIGRVGIGLLCGGGLLAISYKLKENYKAFSSVIVAGSISVFYFTIAIAFHDYHIFNQTTAFILMVIITAFSALISLNYDRQELAVLSLVGGFAVPFMLSTGEGNYIVLFTYITILNVGILGLAYYKKWNIVNILSFVFTTILFNAWVISQFDTVKHSCLVAFLFATGYYFIFSIMSVLYNIRNKGEFTINEYLILLANTFVYFFIGLKLINYWELPIKGLFTLSLALYNLIYAYVLYKKFGINKDTIYLLIGLVLTFITLTIPIQFEGNQITLFWACEGVLLLWLSQKSKITMFKFSTVLIQVLMLVSLILDWAKYYFKEDAVLEIIINPAAITGIVAIVSLFFTKFLLKNENEVSVFYSNEFDPKSYSVFINVVSIIVFYIVGFLEVNYQSNRLILNEYSATSILFVYHLIYSFVLLFMFKKDRTKAEFKISFFIGILNVILYVLYFHKLPNKELLFDYINNQTYLIAFVIHYIVLAIVGFNMFYIYKEIKHELPVFQLFKNTRVVWVLAFIIVFVLSNELLIHVFQFTDKSVFIDYLNEYIHKNKISHVDAFIKEFAINDKLSHLKIQISKIGFPILWGVLSFVFLIFGIKKQWKEVRVIALTLLGLTILKLFIYDIKNVSETGKIIAFILLGVLILIISFVYQKIKRLVVDEEISNTNSNEK